MFKSIVLAVLLSYWVYSYAKRRRRQHKIGVLFGERNGCLSIGKRLPFKWPLGLDVLKRQYDALVTRHLLSFQAEYFEKTAMWGLSSRQAGLLPMIGEGIFTQDGRHWKRSREILRRQFTRIQYQDIKVFDRPPNDMLASLSSYKGTVDLQPFFFRFTLATTTSLIFGEVSSGLPNREHELFEKNFDYCSLISAIRLRLADLCWLYTPRKFRKACDDIKEYAGHYVRQALQDKDSNGFEAAFERHPFILDLYNELNDAALVRDQLIHVLIAGRDTTACLLSWTFFNLVRHPKTLKRLRQEIELTTGSGIELTRAQINKMPYLKCVLNETSRLYTQIPHNIRVAT
ncbi:hypothetical protein EAF04_001945 [Stromatinia cepivora]|nr:hypothetical protein EAF04_001945 [Stromatinia cepivora]